jgi:hypothetical protein
MLFTAICLHEPHGMMEYSNWGEAPNLRPFYYPGSTKYVKLIFNWPIIKLMACLPARHLSNAQRVALKGPSLSLENLPAHTDYQTIPLFFSDPCHLKKNRPHSAKSSVPIF